MNRDNSFNFLRFYAAIGVLLGHATIHTGISFAGYGDGPKPFYHLGVPLFFILSGFFLYPSYSKLINNGGSIPSFLTKRYRRIAPSIYFYTIVTATILTIIGALNFSEISTLEFGAWLISNLVLFPVYNPLIFSDFGIGVLNGSLWTIVAQVSFYLFIPFIFMVEKKYGFKKMMIIMIILSILGAFGYWFLKFLPETLMTKVYGVTFIPNFIYFSLGILWSKVWKDVEKGSYIFIGCVLIVLSEKIFGWGLISPLQMLISALPLSYAIIWFGFNAPAFFKKFNLLEDIGMGIYIWHMVVINLFIYYGIQKVDWLDNPLIHLFIIIVTISLAYVSRVLIEKPFIKNESYSHIPNLKTTS